MSATDHAAEAIRLAEIADRSYGQIEHRNGVMAISQQVEAQTLAVTAQVHATLALAQQQRIANLIAFVQAGNYSAAHGNPSDGKRLTAAAIQIQDGLGLS